ncbi:recombinase RecT [Sphingobacterium faecium]|uniref:recombinase RecT n=1 Tax=Sphingobacterium faecium TaxID=34087 RepID=UPI0021B5A000|nr:recombinase RecT [Sphingobacterium faecium]UXD67776.1 recombinase RecT [Sphingobacterium faecium]
MTQVATTAKNNQVGTPQISQSDRFTQAVMKEFVNNAGDISVTNFQKKLIQNYFIKLDMTLKENEVKRLGTDERYRTALEFIWKNVNMQQLALDVVSYSSVGLDPLQDNHINLIPYHNKKTSQFDIGFIIGYEGLKIKAIKYGFEVPDDVIVELVYSNDTFKSHKKNKDNRVESYDFDIVDDFNRGEIIGGFYYHVFHDRPEKNRLKVMTMRDIEKRRPKKAAAEFWGGEKDKWVDGKKQGKETVEGWFDEMCEKTIKRAAYNAITIDSEKIDEHLVKIMQLENQALSGGDTTVQQVSAEISNNANKQTLSFEDADVVETKALDPASVKATVPPVKEKQPISVADEPKASVMQPNHNPGGEDQVEMDF